MNISLADYYQKYPYIVTLRKYWLEYENINEFPDYRNILSQEQIEALYNVIKKNTTLENYISGKKWGDNLIENNYITNLIKKPEKEIEQDDEDIQETEIRNIFSKLVNIKNKNLIKSGQTILLNKPQDLYFIGDDNFIAITKYNRSHFYAKAVYDLSLEFKQ